ncbi:HAD superfamily hydrolase [Pseudomonas syringae pv. philadelphi]|uniref:HAD superfamily hydrolase n=1 Tax=Pseudomonas syringae pv. philadelphi TaxID=251706 RepID=A0A3M3ZUB9_9PSED|nr:MULTISPECIES: HAD family phosphatase [Pseudomonas syringae group]RMO98191.1 HAD superfamily hydrolase [Pseudomonas syringae pv. philadelphi]SDX41112.1 Haloacid dehalogenase superfamily, subfamily IA, variant 2 with 3rd motif like haloacid dehalogenase/haloacid dehalogenase superfamily, subfamily IA, variant 3 with third motif having DD or ED/haloacid dehalogenase superfamily, subfamily IA, variant 1 with third motif having Dx(3-4)D or Dx(3-4)E [Pseudomonas syringae]SFM54759.1 Haloacid dehalog
MIKAVIFDMDGVLIEAKEWHYDALNKALGLFGYNISRHEHLTAYDGLPTSRKLDMLSVERDLPVALHAFINEMKQQYTMEIVYAQCKPTFVHQYALSSLKAQGYKLAVASNSIRNTVEVMMDRADLSRYLDLQLSNEDVMHAKPAPDIYTKAIRQLGLLPEECLIVEDNENGIKAARASGAHVLVVAETCDVNLNNIMGRLDSINLDKVASL